jgi:hypothetical protein
MRIAKLSRAHVAAWLGALLLTLVSAATTLADGGGWPYPK